MKTILARLVLALSGWKLVGDLPADKHIVLIAAPHTTNWDLVYLLALGWSVGFYPNWMGKHTLFKPPFGALMRWLGGVPVRRDRRNDLVQAMIDTFDDHEVLVMTVPPEGTRGGGEYWKSGFYRIALGAGVPIHMGYLDYPSKTGSFGPKFMPVGDPKRDMDVIRAFYADKVGKNHEDFIIPRLRDEDAPEGASEPR